MKARKKKLPEVLGEMLGRHGAGRSYTGSISIRSVCALSQSRIDGGLKI